MTVVSQRHTLATRGQGHVQDITPVATRAVHAAGLANGIVVVFVVGSTAAITTIEFEPGAVEDFNRMFGTVAPRDAEYEHHKRWGDDNGSSHVRAALLGPSLTVPVVKGELALGTWQQIVLVEFDTQARRREIVFQIMGE
jgi:secondary thiamine-phosphate synthase enzyme